MPDTAAERDVVAHGFVQGRVQGVWFRESTRRRAVELGLSGFVRNLPDGRVEAQFVGPIAAVKLARSFIEQGPPQARVDYIATGSEAAEWLHSEAAAASEGQ